MAITTFATLKTAIANWLHDDSLTSRIPEFVSLAEDDIAQRFRIRPMETAADVTISAQTAALPTRYVQGRRFYLNTNPIVTLKYIDPFNFWETYLSSETGKPVAFTIEGENFVFGPTPDATYTGKSLYYQRFAALSDDADTNWILTNARGLLLYGALTHAAPFLADDPRIVTWATMYESIASQVEAADKRDRHSGSPRQMRSGVGGMSSQ